MIQLNGRLVSKKGKKGTKLVSMFAELEPGGFVLLSGVTKDEDKRRIIEQEINIAMGALQRAADIAFALLGGAVRLESLPVREE